MRKLKKYLICAIIFGTTFLAQTTATFATDLSGQSHDVVVGEVDRIDTDDKDQDIKTPETGIFGLNTDNIAVVAPLFCTVPIVAIVIFLLKRTNKSKH